MFLFRTCSLIIITPPAPIMHTCRVITANADTDGTKHREATPAENNNKHCGAVWHGEAGAKDAHFPLPPMADEPPLRPPPYRAQMFPIKGPRQPLRPEYVNQDKEPFRERGLRGCTLLFSLSLGYNRHFQDGEPPPPVPRGHRRLRRSEQNM